MVDSAGNRRGNEDERRVIDSVLSFAVAPDRRETGRVVIRVVTHRIRLPLTSSS
jgi:hypothetical protein